MYKLFLASILFIFSLSTILAQERCDNGGKCGYEAPCCSQFGYCGSSWEHCGVGCNFGLSFTPQSCFNYKPPIHHEQHTNPDIKRCSTNSHCPFDAPCCSQFGYCGSGPDYCHSGCNPYGSYSHLSCGNKPPISPVYPPNNIIVDPHYPSVDVMPIMPDINNEWNYPNNGWDVQTCNAWKENFSTEDSLTSGGNFIYGGPVSWERNSLSLKIIKNDNMVLPSPEMKAGAGGWARTKKYYHYGRFTARIKSARVGGVVSAFNLISKDGDEVDFEWVGHKETSVQTNYYYKGILDYSKGQFYDCTSNTHYNYHTYTINWTRDFISFYVDNVMVRKITKESTYNPSTKSYNFPTSPVQVQFMLWDGGAGSPGTRDWAGGYINWNDQEILSNGGFIDMKVEYFNYEC